MRKEIKTDYRGYVINLIIRHLLKKLKSLLRFDLNYGYFFL